jgi:hypothetical protein
MRWATFVFDEGVAFFTLGDFTVLGRKMQSSRCVRFGRTKKWHDLRENMIELCDA